MKYKNITLKPQTEYSKLHRIGRKSAGALLCAAVFAAFMFCFCADVTVRISAAAVLFTTAVTACIVPEKRTSSVTCIAAAGAVIICIAINSTGFYRGCINFINQLITVYNVRFSGYNVLFSVGECSAYDNGVFWCAFSAIAGGFAGISAAKGRSVITAIIGGGILFGADFFRLDIPVWVHVAFCFGWLMVFAYKNTEFMRLRVRLYTALVLIVCMAVSCFATSGFTGSYSVEQLKKTVLEETDKIRYGQDLLPQGDMTAAAEMSSSEGQETERLSVSGSGIGEMVLRGFVGSDFDGRIWSAPSREKYSGESSGMVEWLESQGFFPQFQSAAYQRATSLNGSQSMLTVNNKAAYSRYVYVPYTVSSIGNKKADARYDWQIQSAGVFGLRSYNMTVAAGSGSAENYASRQYTAGEAAQVFEKAENVYRTFVYDSYCDVPEDETETTGNLFFGGEDASQYNFSQITAMIRMTLQNTAKYSVAAESFDGTEDFITWLAQGNHTANSAYYATAAVMAYRYAGIPARYAEGYYISDEKAADAESGSVSDAAKSVSLTDSDTHAWAEVYRDGVGWLYVELVPGSFYADYTTQSLLPSPENSVNIVPSDSETVKGSTADELKSGTKRKPQIQRTPVEKGILAAGTAVLILMIIFVLRYAIRFQRRFRYHRWEKYITDGNPSEQKCRSIYKKMFLVLKIVNVAENSRFPYKYGERFGEFFNDITKDEYMRFVSIVQKSVFSQEEVTEQELMSALSLYRRTAQEAAAKTNAIREILLKYVYVLL